MTGILLICSLDAHALFDSRVTHSFISPSLASCFRRDPSPLSEHLIVAIPMGDSLLANSMYRSYEVLLGGNLSTVNLIVLDMVDF